MKKGCFISVIFILTLLVAVSFYIFMNYESEIKEFGKQKIIELAEIKIKKGLDDLPNQQYVDSLKSDFARYFAKLKSENVDSLLYRENNIKNLTSNFDVIIIDEKIDSAEYIFITKQLEKK